ncbi:Maf family protein [Cohnella zeiphila]|uniref:dTTP/UTP pyrophosphatase n=1 Tax=Cohnella zeiphila TaxID=2761120 RepID=A0A7X0SG26_9BACL|nr:Maf family protein [Cohnella zeiphila]MBB6729312.1 septum formation inhibitor Maf [Cohnella zeiphila]
MNADSSSNTRAVLALASSSPRRRELIALLGLPVRVVPSSADESTPPGWLPSRIVEELARRKAQAVAGRSEATDDEMLIVVGSDTIVVLDGEAMGKPADAEDAVATLRRLSGRTHEVYTGVSCIEVRTGRTLTAHRVTSVRMKELSEERIARYVATGEPLDKAGSYGIQGIGSLLVEGIEGCYFNVVGLPLSLLADLLERYGIVLP